MQSDAKLKIRTVIPEWSFDYGAVVPANDKAEPASIVEISSRDALLAAEAELLKHPQVELTVNHHFAPGVYARELVIPAGVLLTGKIHRTEHLNVVSKGKISVFTEDGGTKVIEAPCMFVSKPGTKRMGYAHRDTVWTTIHVTDKTDLAEIEREVIAPTFDDLKLPQIEEK